MKAPTLFKEYIWLVDTIFQARKISLAEINERYRETDMSGGLDFSRTTFNRHKDAIQDIFGIYIECDLKDGYRYYIGNRSVLGNDSVSNWMLETLSVGNILAESVKVQDRIVMESSSSHSEYVAIIIEAMKKNLKLLINYQKYGSDEVSERLVEPYCLKMYHRRWYLLAKQAEFRTFGFDRISRIKITTEKFKLDKDFRVSDYYRNSFGVVVSNDVQTEKVIIRAYGNERYNMETQPLHHSQKVKSRTKDYTDFSLYLQPTYDFIGYILSRASYVKVISPEWLAKEVKDKARKIVALYR